MKEMIKNVNMPLIGLHERMPLKTGLAPMLLGMSMLGTTSSVLAVDECGPGPTVSCTVENYTATGVTYDFSTDFRIDFRAHRFGTSGLRLNGSGDADLSLTATGGLNGLGGIHLNLDSGNVDAEFRGAIMNVGNNTDRAIGVGLNISTAGAANVRLFGNSGVGTAVHRTSNLSLNVGQDSRVWIDHRRAVLSLNLNPDAGATLTIDNDEGVLGTETADRVNSTVAIRGSGAGHVVINNALIRGRINANMDFTGMTGRLTILNDYSGNPRQGGWHTMATNVFGAGEVEIQNRRYGVLRTTTDAVLDFSDTRDARFYNSGRVMVGATDGPTFNAPEHHLRLIGLDLFENSGLILLGVQFQDTIHKGLISSGIARDRITFEDSHYVGQEGGRIAMDVLLGRNVQTGCDTPVTVADCARFTGSSTTAGTTLLTVRDVDPALSVAGFNAGMVVVEGASAAEHFVLDPDNQFYVGHTSGGPALQKGMIAYHLVHDAGARQHALVGALADEGVQAATLGAAAHEVWRASADTWFDRQASLQGGEGEGFAPQGLWAALNTVRGDRSLIKSVDVAGTPSSFNLNQDQDITHFAFGLDLLSTRSGAQSWGGGVTAGLLNSTVDYEATRTQTTMRGMSAGLYAYWALGDLTVDGLFNTNYLRQSIEGGNFGLGPHNRLRTQVKSNGGRVEAAWKLSMSEHFWLQPLLGVSHVRTSEGDITLPDDVGGVRFGSDDRSWRVGAGLRVGLDSQLAGLRAQYRLTGRMWNEREARNTIQIDSTEAPIGVQDDFSGNFNELDGSLSLSSESGALSGYVGVKHKFADDYSSFGGSAGVRYSW